MIGIFIKNGIFGTDTQEGRPYHNRGKLEGCSYKPRKAKGCCNCEKLERGKEGLLPRALRGSMAKTLIFGLPASRIVIK